MLKRTIAILVALPGVLAAQGGAAAQSGAAAQPDSVVHLDRVVAVVDTKPILYSDVARAFQARAEQDPNIARLDSAGQVNVMREILNSMVDQEVVIYFAALDSVRVTDEQLAPEIDAYITDVRGSFPSEAEFSDALRQEGYASISAWRSFLFDQSRRAKLFPLYLQTSRQNGKLSLARVSDSELDSLYQARRNMFGAKPASVTFRQIVVPVTGTADAKAAAKTRAESLLVQLRAGANFDSLARVVSMDSTRRVGGDLGMRRRGTFVNEFERWYFRLGPGELSPVFETKFGYHIIKVEKVQAAQVQGRHILIRAQLDTADENRAKALADSIARMLRNGARFDSLADAHADPLSPRMVPEPLPVDSLPLEYRNALRGQPVGTVTQPFPTNDPSSDFPAYVVATVTSADAGGVWTESEIKATLRRQLQEAKSVRNFIDDLRRKIYVRIMF